MISHSVTDIYVALLDEGTDVWRPVSAIQLGQNVFRLQPNAPPSDDEEMTAIDHPAG